MTKTPRQSAGLLRFLEPEEDERRPASAGRRSSLSTKDASIIFMRRSLQQIPQHPVRVLQEPAGDLVVLRVPVGYRLHPILAELQDLRPGEGHQNGRVGGDDELAVLPHQLVQQRQQAQLPGGRQGRLRLVQQVQPLPAEPVLHPGQDAPWDWWWRDTPP